MGEVSSSEAYDDPDDGSTAVRIVCPRWCASHHVDDEVEERGEVVHLSGALMVERTVLRLASSVDVDTGAEDGPIVYVGEEEYTLPQAEVLIGALSHLVVEGAGRTQLTGRAEPQSESQKR